MKRVFAAFSLALLAVTLSACYYRGGYDQGGYRGGYERDDGYRGNYGHRHSDWR